MSSRYVRSPIMWSRLSLSENLQAACLAVARRGQEYAEATAPRSDPGEREAFDDRFGPRSDDRRYADSFSVEPSIAAMREGPRVSARLVNDNAAAVAVEYGNHATPIPHRTLTRTAAYLRGT